MLLVADSGSTKCDWISRNGVKIQRYYTMGFNPFFHSEDFIAEEIQKNEDLVKIANDVTSLFYYGASVSAPDRVELIFRALKKVFPHANIEVDHDMVGSVHATCGDDPGIACIIGTGSNSCYFDGSTISEKVPALGYILGDEGSGTWLGKALLRDLLYHDLPPVMETAFYETFGLHKEDIFDRIYKKPNVNVFLASFAKFISGFKTEKYVQDLVESGFHAFIKVHVCKFEKYREVPVHFVGSVAYNFSDILKKCAETYGFTIGKITTEPILGLLEYHSGEHLKSN